MRRSAVALSLALLLFGGAPAVRALVPVAAAQDNDKKDKDKQDKDADRKKKEEEEEKKKREKARVEKAITSIVTGFAAKDVEAVLKNVADDGTVTLKFTEAGKKEAPVARQQARGVLDGFFKDWKVIRVDTKSMSVDESSASLPLELYKVSADGERKGKRLRVTVGSADDKVFLKKLVIEW